MAADGCFKVKVEGNSKSGRKEGGGEAGGRSQQKNAAKARTDDVVAFRLCIDGHWVSVGGGGQEEYIKSGLANVCA